MKTAEKRRGTMGLEPWLPGFASIPLSCSTKIGPQHLALLALVYVRQSSLYQARHHRESRERQYALVDFALALGWPRERILVIDDDQGQSSQRPTEERRGFQRVVAEVTMDHVGIILGLEMSRLARCDSEWHRLLELCGVFGTLLADQEGVYDAADPNDRLLLGLKGTISSVELTTMRNRLEKGRLSKAQRGELFYSAPRGYVLLPNGKVDIDPDEQARSVMHLLFEKYEDLGTGRSLFFWLVDHGIALPVRPRTGPHAGQLEWRRPNYASVLEILHHPMYAGAYAYGRRPVDRKRQYTNGKSRLKNWLPMDQWPVLIRDHMPAYISWEQYLRNQESLKQNQTRSDTRGPARQGCALLSGLVVCERCAWRMGVSYRNRDKPYYRCMRSVAEGTRQFCFGVSANVLDELVAQQVLCVLEPAALALSLQAQADVRQERERLERNWQQKLQRTRYEAELAERRYREVDPGNRLVAATLERQWEEALRAQREVQEEYDRFAHQTLPHPSAEEAAHIAGLGADIPALWQSPHTTNADRQAIVRCLVERVVVGGERGNERVTATIRWAGGYESRLEFARPVRTYEYLSESDTLMRRIAELRERGKTAEETADIINAEGFKPINPGHSFNRDMVRDLLLKLGLYGEQNDDSLLGKGEWWIRDLAEKLEIPWQTLREWAVKGWAHGRQTKIQKLWILWADREERKRLRQLRAAQHRGILGYPAELTTPKPRP